METRRSQPSAREVLEEANGFAAGLSILTMMFFPFALPFLLLIVAPLAIVGLIGALLAAPVAVPVWLLRRRRSSRSPSPEGRLGKIEYQPVANAR